MLYYYVENRPELIGNEGLGLSKYSGCKNVLSSLDLMGDSGY
jgi:hypothetical protein